ncbi:AraC family transcriptional regulator [Amycolatopsis japonica]|uniref:AraC family transcriptional regulator n=1 Tax=Amycolatopsis japonica TaxID=208439 RepID=UPI003670D607
MQNATTARTVPIDFVRAAVAMARRRGFDVDQLLRSVGVAPELLAQDRSRITVEQVTKVVREMWRVTDDELFGLGARPVPRGSLRLACFGLLNCPDLGAAMARFAEYQRLLPGLPPMSVLPGDEVARFTMDPETLDDPEHLLTDFILAAAHRFTGWAIGRRIRLHQVELPYPRPENVADYDLLFGAPAVFDAEVAALVFDSDILSAPIVRTEESLIAWDRNAPADLLARRDYGTSLADQVRAILARGLGGTWPTSDEVAKRLAMSQQTVRRKLGEEGTSITQLREDILRDAAVASLVRGGETVEELSERLGYSEPSAFRRAFRRWTGSPPGSYGRDDVG